MSQDNMKFQTKLQQESFFTDNNQPTLKRKKIIRQDRWQVESGICFITNDLYNLEVVNLSSFGCACLVSNDQVKKFDDLLNSHLGLTFKLNYGNFETQSLSLKVTRIEKTENNSLQIGFETINEPINIERCKAISEANQIVQKQNSNLQIFAKIPPLFKNSVYELKEWFTQLKFQIDEIEKTAPIDDAKANAEFRLTVAETISEYLGQFLPSAYKSMPEFLSNISKEDALLCTNFIRQQLAPFVYGAPFANRAFYKPRGYAGDYEMMNHLYRNELVGKTLFDQCMHKYFIDEPAGVAVKNRGEYLHKKIKQLIQAKAKDKKIKILSIASGPAMEQQLFIKNNPEFYGRNIEFSCIDQDEESLKHAQKQLLSLERQKKSGFKFLFSNLAIKNIIAQGLPENDYDLIYSAGLFDYFTDPVAQVAARQMINAVKSDGQVIIGNFSKNNPSTPFMEYVLDWILIYRSPADMMRLFESAGKTTLIEQEHLGINLFAVINKS